MTEERGYTVVLLREADGRYSVSVPALDGCFTWGRNVSHALQMAEEAIELFLEVLEEDGETPPADVSQIALDLGSSDEALVYRIVVRRRAATVA